MTYTKLEQLYIKREALMTHYQEEMGLTIMRVTMTPKIGVLMTHTPKSNLIITHTKM